MQYSDVLIITRLTSPIIWKQSTANLESGLWKPLAKEPYRNKRRNRTRVSNLAIFCHLKSIKTAKKELNSVMHFIKSGIWRVRQDCCSRGNTPVTSQLLTLGVVNTSHACIQKPLLPSPPTLSPPPCQLQFLVSLSFMFGVQLLALWRGNISMGINLAFLEDLWELSAKVIFGPPDSELHDTCFLILLSGTQRNTAEIN